MEGRSVVSEDQKLIVTNLMCPSCLKRIPKYSPNPRYLVPPTREVENPARKLNGGKDRRQHILTVAQAGNPITQDQIVDAREE